MRLYSAIPLPNETVPSVWIFRMSAYVQLPVTYIPTVYVFQTCVLSYIYRYLLCVWFAYYYTLHKTSQWYLKCILPLACLDVLNWNTICMIINTWQCFSCVDLFAWVVQGTLDVDALTEAHLSAVNECLHTLLSLAVECNKPCIVEKLLEKGLSQKTKDFRATEV